ncbi:MAG: cupredoxin domain-containing protein [Nitrosopumilaceae archaeon]
MKKSLTVTTIILFAIGIGSALYVLYDHIESADRPKLIGKEEAQAVAIESGRWDKSLLDDKTITTTLLHIKNDGFAFVVDEKTLEDKSIFMNRYNQFNADQYIWQIIIQMKGGSNREWIYLIDASEGALLNPSQSTSVLEPTDPQVAIREDTVIHQVKGDVTIVFPQGVSNEEPKQSPFPAQLIITEGDTVTWRNDDKVPHTVTSGFQQQQEFIGQIFDSGIIASEQSFSHTFSDKKIMSYHYFCTIHPWMTGEVMVQHTT